MRSNPSLQVKKQHTIEYRHPGRIRELYSVTSKLVIITKKGEVGHRHCIHQVKAKMGRKRGCKRKKKKANKTITTKLDPPKLQPQSDGMTLCVQ